MNEAQQSVFALFPGQRPILYHPGLAEALGSINASILLCQLLYWHDKGSKKGWIYKTIVELEEETGISRHKQDTAIQVLENLGLISHKRMGSHGKRHFQVHLSAIYHLLSLSEIGKQESTKSSDYFAEKRQPITETTQQNTAKTTKNAVGSGEPNMQKLGDILGDLEWLK